MENQGWIKLHRKIIETSFYWGKPLTVALFIHLLLNANHKAKRFLWNYEEIEILPGQMITGLESLSKNTGLSVRQTRTALSHLKATSTITIKSTNRFSVITICKWNEYQVINKQIDKLMTNKRQTDDKLTTTNNNDKNDNKVKNDIF